MPSENGRKNANERKISELILSLLSHYWTAEDDPAIRKLQALDWVDDLAQFPAEVVAEACRMWRRANRTRPTPHDIRSLALAERAARATKLADMSRYPGCLDRWPSCTDRWHARGFICQPSCRDQIPGYRTLTDDEAFMLCGELGLPRSIEREAKYGKNPMEPRRSPRV